MKPYNRIIFVCTDNSCRSPVAAAIFKNINRTEDIKVVSRGLVVLFPEPYNPKAASILRSNGIILENGQSTQLENDDFAAGTLVLTMDRLQKQRILEDYPDSANVFSIMEFAGGSGDIMDPYGGDMEVYMLFYKAIKAWIDQVENKIYEMSKDNNEEEN